MKSCFFIGHRYVYDDIMEALEKTVEQHIVEYGVTEFFVGGYGQFDSFSAGAVIRAKKRHPEILLRFLLPYHPAERRIELPLGFDSSFYPPGMERVPRRFAIVRANQYMVDHVDYLIAYAWHPSGSARKILEYAQKREQQNRVQVTLIEYKWD